MVVFWVLVIGMIISVALFCAALLVWIFDSGGE